MWENILYVGIATMHRYRGNIDVFCWFIDVFTIDILRSKTSTFLYRFPYLNLKVEFISCKHRMRMIAMRLRLYRMLLWFLYKRFQTVAYNQDNCFPFGTEYITLLFWWTDRTRNPFEAWGEIKPLFIQLSLNVSNTCIHISASRKIWINQFF